MKKENGKMLTVRWVGNNIKDRKSEKRMVRRGEHETIEDLEKYGKYDLIYVKV